MMLRIATPKIFFYFTTRDSPQYFDLSRRIARFMNRVLALSMMMPKHTYLACTTHTRSDIQYTELRESHYCLSTYAYLVFNIPAYY